MAIEPKVKPEDEIVVLRALYERLKKVHEAAMQMWAEKAKDSSVESLKIQVVSLQEQNAELTAALTIKNLMLGIRDAR